MSIDTASEIWEVLRDHIDLSERSDAAETLVTYLIENNYEISDIKDAFRDKDITKALKNYTDEHFQDEDEEEYEEEYDDDWD